MDDSSENSLNEAFKSASFGDRVWLFFTERSRLFVLLGGILVASCCLGILIAIGNNISQCSMRNAYNDAIFSGNIDGFTKKYSDEKLAGSLFSELGDRRYRDGDFQMAARYYHQAANALGGNIFGGKAAINEGISLIRSGDVEGGERLLAKIAEEKSYAKFIRGKAMWLWGISLLDRGESSRARDIQNKLSNSDFSNCWKTNAQALLREI